MKITRRLLLRCSAVFAGCLVFTGASTKGSFMDWLQKVFGKEEAASSSAASSAASSQPAASSAPALPPYDADPLTGEAKTGNGRIIGVMVNNICNSSRQNARPHRGLSSASILIESKVEGNISRLCALYNNVDAIPEVGPLRSGRAQLAELKARFTYPEVDTVFSSPMLRAVETANILFPGAAHQFTVHDLREAHFGVFENRPVKELVKDPDFSRWITPGSGFTPEGAEPTADFHRRCGESLLKLFEYMIRMDVTEAACVTHGGVIVSMLSQHALPSRRPEQWMADPGCGYTVQTDVQLWMRDRMVEAIDIVPYGYADTLRGQAETEENESYR